MDGVSDELDVADPFGELGGEGGVSVSDVWNVKSYGLEKGNLEAGTLRASWDGDVFAGVSGDEGDITTIFDCEFGSIVCCEGGGEFMGSRGCGLNEGSAD